MTDRELLEAAAKAAGLELVYRPGIEGMWNYTQERGYFGPCFNPLDSDGDNRRLEVKLKIELEFGSDFVNAGNSQTPNDWFLAREEYGADPCAATRRAIVRAAAAMVKAPLPKENP